MHAEPTRQIPHIEPDRVATRLLASIMVCLAIAVTVMVLGLRELTLTATAAERERKVVAGTGEIARVEKAKSRKVLSSYDVQDAKKGVYSVPVEEAMKLVVQRPELVANPAALGVSATESH